jgi:ABC-2 type transport system permease protein
MAFTVVLCLFMTVMTNVFTPATIGGLGEMASGTIAGNLLKGANTLVGFMANSFYTLMAIIFPMLYSIIVGNRLVAEKVDHGDMSGLLSTPTKRISIVITKAIYFVCSLVLMWTVIYLVGLGVSQLFQPGELDLDTFLLLNIGCLLYHLAISSICYIASCVFNVSKMSMALGGGISLFFYVIALIVKLSDNLDILKYFTLNTLYDTEKIIEGSGYGANFLILAITAVVLYTSGIIVFCKKDLPL